MADTGGGRRWIFVCPDPGCDEWAAMTGNGYPLGSSCEHLKHPEAELVEVVEASRLAAAEALAAKYEQALGRIAKLDVDWFTGTTKGLIKIARKALAHLPDKPTEQGEE